MTTERASRSTYSAGSGSRSFRYSSGPFPSGLPLKYWWRAPGLAIGFQVGLATARLRRPPTMWCLRPSISAHWTTRWRISGATWRMKASSAS